MSIHKGKRILITGATGLIGTQVSLALLKRGWKLVVLGRSSEADFRNRFSLPCDYFEWRSPTDSTPPREALDVDVVLNLMGESIADRRWTTDQKSRLRNSRILTTRNLVQALHQANPHLSAFISGSAIGVYGEAGNTVLTESSPFAQDFLGTLCHEWELEAKKAPGRVALIRTGVVLSTQGGALGQMIPLFEQGLGSKLAGGRQWMSWIHIDDLVEVFVRAIEDSDFEGAFNGVSPFPVSNAEFTKLLAEYLKVGTFLPVPKLALDLALGEMAQILICSQRVSPQALESKGFHFQFPSLSAALGHLFNWKESRHDRIFEASQWVPQPRNVVFPFFSDAMNLEVLTPPFLNFRVLKTSTKTIQSGMEIDYKLKIHGVPVKWRSKICDWDPENRFRDVQLKGPYQKWDHTHTFEDLAGGTLLNDKVIYRLPWAGWGGNLTSPLVKRDIMQIFSYRMKKIRELFFGT